MESNGIKQRIEELEKWIQDTYDAEQDLVNGKEIARKQSLIRELKSYSSQFDTLEEENKRLREALEKISNITQTLPEDESADQAIMDIQEYALEALNPLNNGK